jgi:hypothetical protein
MWSGSSWVASPSDSFMRIFPNAFVGIEETKPVISKLLVYPTPANSVCYVDMHVENMAPLTITIYNLEGRILRQSGHSGNTDYHISIPVSDLPAGNYILSAEQNNQRVAKQLSIVR